MTSGFLVLVDPQESHVSHPLGRHFEKVASHIVLRLILLEPFLQSSCFTHRGPH